MRPQTYEDEQEAKVMLSLWSGSGGELKNTVFCILAPDGKTKLTRAGRSPAQLFDDGSDFASFLTKTSKSYQRKAKDIQSLPVLDELPLAINVASCDQVPLVILKAKTKQQLKALEKKVAKIAWSKDFIGRQHFVTVLATSQASKTPAASHAKKRGETVLPALKIKSGITIVKSDAYGLNATTLAYASPSASAKNIATAFIKAHKAHTTSDKDRRSHTRTARRQGITWDSELEVTDDGGGRGRRRR